MSEWLVTLRKHRNYCLAERQRGFETNNQKSDLSAKTLKTYRGTLGKLRLSEMILPVMANRIRARTVHLR
ncbi:hypothetical protein [Dolichospermum heterosporum]|uniref:Transposase n=1 Tax=Dolichospermum heterosporum TAC447 TaxID=747523 RepID=A0ABY5LZJ5_9CYAN|nr:hypothetical protein [Dolichospermum heterosporum]UUO14999.1 hypothetical protein NG743_23815 [Dolichospermum heterosporum TAC447]